MSLKEAWDPYADDVVQQDAETAAAICQELRRQELQEADRAVREAIANYQPEPFLKRCRRAAWRLQYRVKFRVAMWAIRRWKLNGWKLFQKWGL